MTTPYQKALAIAQLKRAFTACKKADVAIFAMDDTIYAAKSYDATKDFHEQYQYAPDLIETVVIGAAFKGSGGW